MQHFNVLRTIFLILGLGFALVTFGCATGENQVSGFPSDIEISAVTVSEGIRITFSNYSNIPPEMDSLTVFFTDWFDIKEHDLDDNDQLAIMNYLSNKRDFFTVGNVIEQVRQTGTITFPFSQPGQKYIISAYFFNGESTTVLDTEYVAVEGIYFNKNITLNMNDDQTGIALSGEPEFTSDVEYGKHKIIYNITIHKGDDHKVDFLEGFSNYTDDLFWNFGTSFSEYLMEKGVANGDYSAIVQANLHIIHENISWILEIAQTPIFTYSF
jgi:hypothetical protein